ncbi:MAG: glycosyltransferase family 4 protein [Clostridiaceae bacterium]|nr:glycosyltransferase family 4 protein [Clostridiaceae bacterium]
MNTPKVLALSYAFPPMAFPQSIQISRLLECLNCDCVVICGLNPAQRCDNTISPEIEHRMNQIIRVYDSKTRFQQYFGAITALPYMSLWSNIPDNQYKWITKAYKHYRKWQKDNSWQPDVLLTFGQPMSDHLFGLQFKENTGLPWIAHFSDPWIDSIFRKDNPVAYYRNKLLERKVINNADAVIFTSQETIDLVMNKYPRSWYRKAHYVPHSLKRDLYDLDISPLGEYYVMRAIGNFYGARSPEPLFKGLEQIYSITPKLTENLKIEIVGSLDRGLNSLFSKYKGIEHLIQYIESVSYEQSIKMMQTAHCLVVIDAPAESSVFFPSKLVDYIGANRYIFAISPPGTTSRLVTNLEGIAVDPLDSDGICLALEQILKKRPSKLPKSTDEYDSGMVGMKMRQIIESIVYG